jgi:pepF/M3 family oligoendopeptidase
MTTIPPAPTWDLDSIFPGGSKSIEFKAHRQKSATDLDQAATRLEALPADITEATVGSWSEFIVKLQALSEDIDLTYSMAGCLSSQNVEDKPATAIEAEADVQVARWEKLLTGLESRALNLPDDQWELLLSQPVMAEVRFYLDERRTIAKSKMPLEQETLALDLAVNGLHAWSRLYDKIAGDIRVSFTENGETRKLSMGQIATKLSDPNRSIRRQAFDGLVEGWERQADMTAMALNNLAGFRLALNSHRKWESPLYEPLVAARLQRQSLDTMWEVIRRETKKLQPYIEAKKKLLAIDKFCWYDEFAPCGKVDKLYSFEEAGRFIVEQAAGFSTHMAEFMQMALAKRWVEGEDRPGKRAGGYCTSMGPIKESRIFMTYAGSFENLLTLAHELGHAYHQWVLKDRPPFASGYPMNLAETASIFTETLVIDAALEATDDPQEKLMLLEQKLQGAYVMFTDIHCRYLFEKDFYAARKDGVVSRERLSELMVDAQRRAFAGLLDESGHHPLFWCSKLHFYYTEVPFYNFPYTFGYLFAGGVYDRAQREGSAFADKYSALLSDTGSMTSEDVASKHLGVDLTNEVFWADAVGRSLADVEAFVKLARKVS